MLARKMRPPPHGRKDEEKDGSRGHTTTLPRTRGCCVSLWGSRSRTHSGWSRWPGSSLATRTLHTLWTLSARGEHQLHV